MSFLEEYKQKLVSADEAVKIVKSGDWVDYGWCTGTPDALGLIGIIENISGICHTRDSYYKFRGRSAHAVELVLHCLIICECRLIGLRRRLRRSAGLCALCTIFTICITAVIYA